MKERVRNSLLVGAGFLAGSLGLKALVSPVAKRGYVKVLVQGMKAKSACLNIAEQAKAEYDDIMAEATYLAKNDTPTEAAEACSCGCGAPAPAAQ